MVLSWGYCYLIYLYVIFFSVANNVNFGSYADDSTSYVIGNGVIQVTVSLKEASDELFCSFAYNQMKENPNKCHLTTSSTDKVSIYVKNCNIKSSKCEIFDVEFWCSPDIVCKI